jgi:hypothetical protein
VEILLLNAAHVLPNYSNAAVIIATFLVINSGVYFLPVSNRLKGENSNWERKTRDFNLITLTPKEKIGVLIIVIM